MTLTRNPIVAFPQLVYALVRICQRNSPARQDAVLDALWAAGGRGAVFAADVALIALLVMWGMR